jgi:hypothetical protein
VGHALIGWTVEHGSPPENLVVLQVPDEEALHSVLSRLGPRTIAFREPDLEDKLTAIAAGPENWREVSSIGLMR